MILDAHNQIKEMINKKSFSHMLTLDYFKKLSNTLI